MSRRLRSLLALALLTALLLAGCVPAAVEPRCTVLFEDDPSLFFYRQLYEPVRGGDVTVSVGVPTGHRITGVSYERCTVSARTGASASYDYYTLILHQVNYPAVIRVETAPAGQMVYHLPEGPLTLTDESPHLRPNTLPYDARLERPGYIPIGWSTEPDGAAVGFGSRIDRSADGLLDLWPVYLPCAPEEVFSYASDGVGAIITGYAGSCAQLVLPASLGGLPVTGVAAGAFGALTLDTLVLPPSLKTVAPGAFSALTVEHLYFFDALTDLSDASFGDCKVKTLHINAVLAPTYIASYFHTFPDKMDYLRSLAGQDKLVLLCGSSARFGYSSPMLETAFPQYKVVNMGVIAYANLLPQARMVTAYLKAGDLVLHTPELDAIDTQFCGESDLGQDLYCLTEGDYDLLTLLDCREFTGVFDAYRDYQADRAGMAPRSYDESPAQFDEDGHPQNVLTYNICGDYILYRENNLSGRCFGIKRAFYNPDHIRERDWAGLNALYDSLRAAGAEVLFAYSPRMSTSLSPDSDADAISALDAAVRERLSVPVISTPQDSLLDPLWFYGTDNHLSTEGVERFTRLLIDRLRTAREETP